MMDGHVGGQVMHPMTRSLDPIVCTRREGGKQSNRAARVCGLQRKQATEKQKQKTKIETETETKQQSNRARVCGLQRKQAHNHALAPVPLIIGIQ